MYIRRLHASKVSRTAAFLCVAVLLSACSHEIQTGGDGDGGSGEIATVTLSVNPTGNAQSLTTKGMTIDQENSMHILYILAFQPDKENPGTYKLAYKAVGKEVTGSGGNGKNFSFSLRRSLSGQADTKLLLVANFNPFTQTDIGMTYEGVQTALTSGELVAAPAFADTGIPMFGFAGNSPDTPLEITDGMQLSANLLRAIARVDVGIGTYNTATGVWNKGGVNFDLTEVYVFKPQNKYSLLPVIGNLEYAGGTLSVTASSPAGTLGSTDFSYTGTAITSNTYCKAEIYIPEVAFNGGTVYDENHESRTALVIGGTYNGRTCYYRIDFTTVPGNTQGTVLHDVLRNHIYRYSITNVSLPGYATPEAAYSGKPIELGFTASITDWEAGITGSPDPDMLVRMNFGQINGTIVTGTIEENGETKTVTVTKKVGQFTTDEGRIKPQLYYNELLGEAKDNLYNGVTNGGLYRSVQDAFTREGPYAQLIIAPDNAAENIVWRSTSAETPKKDRVLNAKQACWNYRGQGRSDWRLPRLSELYLLWLNRVEINSSKGLTSLDDSSNTTYWTGTEGGQDDKAYTISIDGVISLDTKTDLRSVRCVREAK